MKEKKNNLDGLHNKKNNLKELAIGMIILDVIAVLNLILQIYLKDISYSSYVVLIICNVVVFTTYKFNK